MNNSAMQNQQQSESWFLGAPISKLMIYSTIVCYILIESQQGTHDALQVDTSAILNEGQWYRFFTGHLAFRTTGEMVVGVVMLYHLSRKFEREMSSRKYAVFLCGTFLMANCMTFMASQLLFSSTLCYSGPYPTLGALVILFHLYTPRLHPRFFGILGFHISEKGLQYLFILQLLFYHGRLTLVPSLCGMMAGYLMSFIPPMNQLDVPDRLASMVSFLTERFIEDPPPALVVSGLRGRGGGEEVRRQENNRRATRMPVAQPVFESMPPPPESSIEQLTSMGFERDAVMRALQASHNNVERAADRLLSGS